MSTDHARRLMLAWYFLLSGIFVLCVAYVPASSASQSMLGVIGVGALASVALIGRTKLVRDLMSRAPSGQVGGLRPLFLGACVLSILPAAFGLAEVFQQEPLGSNPRVLPNVMLAVFGPYAPILAYCLLAASGRGANTRR
jgi:hypothetical protein